MYAAYRSILEVHVLFGALTLAAFWVAMCLRKGGPRHLALGNVYAWGMYATAASGMLLSALTLLDVNGTHPPEAGWSAAQAAANAEFLRHLLGEIGFAGAVAFSLTYFGARAPHRARRRSRGWRVADVAVPGGLLLAGLSSVPAARLPGLDFASHAGVPAAALALPQIVSVLRARPGRRWIVQHLAGILGASVIGHTAFFVSLVPRVLPDVYGRDPSVNPLAWILPPAIGLVLAIGTCLYWRLRFDPTGQRTVAVAA